MEKVKARQKSGIILREFSSGGAVFKRKKSGILWLILKSAPSKDYPNAIWRLPKGWIDDADEKLPGPKSRGDIRATEKELEETALREVREEGGINSKLIKKIGTEKFFFNSKIRKGKVLKFVTFYLMEWQGDLPEGPGYETSEVSWLPFDDARKKLTHSGERKILDKAKGILDSGIQNTLI